VIPHFDVSEDALIRGFQLDKFKKGILAMLSDVKVGVKLCVLSRLSPKRIEMVLKVTPTGRVVTRSGTFNPDGNLRGDLFNKTRARLATDDDLIEVYRARLVERFRRYDWNKLSSDDLKFINTILNNYN
jgi:hypothetical protein